MTHDSIAAIKNLFNTKLKHVHQTLWRDRPKTIILSEEIKMQTYILNRSISLNCALQGPGSKTSHRHDKVGDLLHTFARLDIGKNKRTISRIFRVPIHNIQVCPN